MIARARRPLLRPRQRPGQKDVCKVKTIIQIVSIGMLGQAAY